MSAPTFPPPHRAGDRLRQAAGARDRAGAGRRRAGRWRCITATRSRTRYRTSRMRQPRAGAALPGQPGRRDGGARPAARGGQRTSAMWTRWSTAPRCSSTTAPPASASPPGKAPAQQHRRRHPAGAGAAPASATRVGRRGRTDGRRGQPAGPEAVEPEPRFPELHAVQGRAGSRQPPCWRWRWRRRAGGRRGARPHADQPPAERRAVSSNCTAWPCWSARPRQPTWPPRCGLRWKTAPSPAPRCWSMAAST
jgi:hypothetical protein